MPPLFERILCPIDFDENSMAALDIATQMAQESKGALYVLHVVRTPFQPSEVPVEPKIAQWERDAEAHLDDVARRHLEGKTKYNLLLKTGNNPAAAIIEAERELRPDAVVLATHGRTGLGHLLIGSVAEHVVRESSCPVVTVRPTAAGA
jgi:universal stress protein A